MKRAVLYMAHPVRPTTAEIAATPSHTGWDTRSDLRSSMEAGGRPISDVQRIRNATRTNVEQALRWLRWLRLSFPETTFIAPWISSLLSGDDDADPAQREAGLVDARAVIGLCDGIVLTGPRVSDGMRREAEHRWRLVAEGGPFQSEVYDLTPTRIYNLIRYPTWAVLTGPSPFHEWYGAVRAACV